MSDTDWPFSQQGRVSVIGGDIWFGVAEELDRNAAPLVVIHGGPGMSHDCLYSLIDLADERAVAFYDQIDAGRSDRPDDPFRRLFPRSRTWLGGVADASSRTYPQHYKDGLPSRNTMVDTLRSRAALCAEHGGVGHVSISSPRTRLSAIW